MNTKIKTAEKPTEEEYAELKRIQDKIQLWIWRGQDECHGDSDYCHKCGHGFPG